MAVQYLFYAVRVKSSVESTFFLLHFTRAIVSRYCHRKLGSDRTYKRPDSTALTEAVATVAIKSVIKYVLLLLDSKTHEHF